MQKGGKGMRKNRIYIMMLFFCMAMSGGCKGESKIETQATEIAGDIQESDKSERNEVSEKKIYVQVSGAVVKPGVYELVEGSRVFEAIEMAGGLTRQADAAQINQVQVLNDGQMIYVMEQGEAANSNEGQQDDGKVNLNTATVEQLMTLPGIGQAKAQSIIAWREENGSFAEIEDLMEIEGIKEGVFSKIKDSIKVN